MTDISIEDADKHVADLAEKIISLIDDEVVAKMPYDSGAKVYIASSALAQAVAVICFAQLPDDALSRYETFRDSLVAVVKSYVEDVVRARKSGALNHLLKGQNKTKKSVWDMDEDEEDVA